jgi:hypothetical protein
MCRSGAVSASPLAAECWSSAAVPVASRPLARAGVELVGIDRSAPMLDRASSTHQVANSPTHQVIAFHPR